MDEIYQPCLHITQIYGFHYIILNFYLPIFYSQILILRHKAVIFSYCIYILLYFKIQDKKKFTKTDREHARDSFGPLPHTCLPIPFAPDPVAGFSHVFGVYSEPIEIVWRWHLSFYLSHYPIRDMNPLIGANSKWKYLLVLKL